MINVLSLIKNHCADTEKRSAQNDDEKKHGQERGEPVGQFAFFKPFEHRIEHDGKRHTEHQHRPEGAKNHKGKKKCREQKPEEKIPLDEFCLHAEIIAKRYSFIK